MIFCEDAIEQIIGAKAETRAFIMRDLLLSVLRPTSLNSNVRHLLVLIIYD